MANILVTGGAGFIGSSLADVLVNSNKICVIDNMNDYYSPKIKKNNISSILTNINYKFFEGDILDYDFITNIITTNNIDTVIHLAARAGVRPSMKQPALYRRVNIDGTEVILKACKKCCVKKIIFASSSSVYGALGEGPFLEDMDTSKTISVYAETKVEGEKLCKEYSKYMQVIVLRFFTVYGPRQRPDLAISKFVNLIQNGQRIPVYGDGHTKRNYTYISDIINGIVLAMNADLLDYEVFNLGGDKILELNNLIQLIESTMNKVAVVNRLPLQKGDVPLTHADISKAKKAFGYAPKISISIGLKNYYEWYIKNNID